MLARAAGNAVPVIRQSPKDRLPEPRRFLLFLSLATLLIFLASGLLGRRGIVIGWMSRWFLLVTRVSYIFL